MWLMIEKDARWQGRLSFANFVLAERLKGMLGLQGPYTRSPKSGLRVLKSRRRQGLANPAGVGRGGGPREPVRKITMR